ncbi:MAG: UvrB/UvrC motif-containing protein [Deltaproteobacteria bacterium]|jgi:excinuclease ABC subunit C|nr:UvrB/UvrC motif-containing protein [Deltaproteobacteria bacterium]
MLKPDLSRIPLTPGVYLFLNAQGSVIYAGKAKNLRRRLASYFRPEDQLTPKTKSMLARAVNLETISTGTDNEALLLEAGLIKKHRPHYNILLRDDKDYPLFRLDQSSAYPRLEITRQSRSKSRRIARSVPSGESAQGKPPAPAKFFGPFSSAGDARAAWHTIHKAFPLRRCSDRSMKNRTRPCLYYHLGQCLAPCVLDVPPEQYAAMTDKIILLLEGKSSELLRLMEHEMRQASDRLEFEKAARLRNQIRAVQSTVEKQSVVLENERDLDAVGLMENERGLGLGLLIVRGGALLGNRNYFWPGLGLADAEELLYGFLLQHYAWTENIPPDILIPWPAKRAMNENLTNAVPLSDDTPPDTHSYEDEIFDHREVEQALSATRGGPVRISSPKSSAEFSLLGLASTNARDHARQETQQHLPQQLAIVFMRDEPVMRIEAVDVSHLAGSATRAGMVVFEDGRPLTEAWRSYSFDPGEGGGDDYAVLAAWAIRRAKEGPPWPDLLLIDGGRGQLNAVRRALSPYLPEQPFALAAIAKARTEEGHSDRRAGNINDRIFLPGRSNPLNLRPGSPELLFLQHVRNQAHNFVIGRHRRARARPVLTSALQGIPGLGPVFTRELWKQFDSLQNMRDAKDEELHRIPGMGPVRIKTLRAHLARIIDRD